MSATRRPPCGPTVGYLTKRFPRLSETFILDEIIGLEQAGVPLRLYAVANPMEAVVQPDVSRVTSPVHYLRGPRRSDVPRELLRALTSHARLAAGSPSRYRRALAMALTDRTRTGTIRPFLDAGRLAVDLRRAGAVHLHAAFAHGPASTARYVHHLTGLPFSFAAHAKDLYLSDAGELAAKADDAEFVLTCSSAAADGLAERLGSASKVVLAYHGVDTSRFRPPPAPAGREGPGRADTPLRLLAVGRLVPKKGYPTLLHALRILADRGYRTSCRIVGGGPDQADLAALARDLDLADAVTFVGALTHQEVAAEYRRADVFVQASVVLADGDRDGIPNSLLEAMASGLPVVASAVSGIPEAVENGTGGLLVAPGDPSALAGALSRIADDRHLAASLRAGARSIVAERFDRHVCAQKLAPRFLPGRVDATPARVHA